MIYFATYKEEVIGFPIVKETIGEAKIKLEEIRSGRLKDLNRPLEELYHEYVECKEKINACDSIMDSYAKSDKKDKDAKETAKQAKKFKDEFIDNLKKIEEKHLKRIEAWSFDINDIVFYAVHPVNLTN